jgi:VCBS repeat-containing protein
LTITLSGANSSSFSLSKTAIDNLAAGANDSFQVTANTGLMPGVYVATITISGDNDISVTFDVSFTVSKASQSAPAAPVLADKTGTVITLVEIAGAEYRMDNGTWQDSPVFEGLTPHTSYIFYARMKETATHEASPVSESLTVATLGIAAELIGLSINATPHVITDTVDYMATCGESSVTLNISASPAASTVITVNGTERSNLTDIPLTQTLTVVKIHVISEDRNNEHIYVLHIYSTVAAEDVLFQRWDDVLAVNSNPDNNGNYRNIDGVRWYRSDIDEAVSEEWFIKLVVPVEHYYAEINLGGKWHRVCGAPEVRSLEKIIAYPNPVSVGDNLNLHLPSNFVGGYVNVVNLAGSTMKRNLPLPGINSIINVSDWSSGIYLLNIIAPDGSRETVKVIVN